MQLRMWMYDLAREQSPSLDQLREICTLTEEAGYNALGLYLEHRFAYPSTPWAHGKGAVTPEMVGILVQEFPNLQIIPFINLLGHFEGLIYTEAGQPYAEEKFRGMQACPSEESFVELAGRLIDDVLACFPSQIIHIGGDETFQLGKCPRCAERVREYETAGAADGKGQLYGAHFEALAAKVAAAGRRPAVWGDMFYDHPTALDRMPAETLIFDWQYFKGPHHSSQRFRDRGLEVVYCPTIQTYDAVWCHLPQSERNVRQHAQAAVQDDAFGVCVTTWECGLFGNYRTLFPALRATGHLLTSVEPIEGWEEPVHEGNLDPEYPALREAPAFLAAYMEESDRHEDWARLMGCALQDVGGIFGYSTMRSSLKSRLLLYSNPFLFWLHHGDEMMGEVGTKALELLEKAISVAPDVDYRGVSEFVRMGVEFARHAEAARRFYAAGAPGDAAAALMPCRQIFENLTKIAKANHLRIGGSLADIERCHAAQRHVELVIRRIREYGDGSLGYLPSFSTLSHPKFVPHDQANWWLINDWANQ